MNKKLANKVKVKKRNDTRMMQMLSNMTSKIERQGRGCTINGYGVAYVNRKENTRDPIGWLLHGNIDTQKHFGLIGDIGQHPLVREISKTYGYENDSPAEMLRLKYFLTNVQNAHDDAFDPYSLTKKENPMQFFTDTCATIKNNIGVQ